MTDKKNSKYSEAGVDIDKGNQFVKNIKDTVASTHQRGVINDIGGFSSLFAIDTEKYKNPVLVTSTDGVGTKLAVAQLCNKHDTIGIDLVAMCVNDIIVGGATPLCFLDYFSVGKLQLDVATDIVAASQRAANRLNVLSLVVKQLRCLAFIKTKIMILPDSQLVSLSATP